MPGGAATREKIIPMRGQEDIIQGVSKLSGFGKSSP